MAIPFFFFGLLSSLVPVSTCTEAAAVAAPADAAAAVGVTKRAASWVSSTVKGRGRGKSGSRGSSRLLSCRCKLRSVITDPC